MDAVKSIDDVRAQLVVETRLGDGSRLLRAVAENGALLKGHFSLQSGQHSQYFIRFAQIGRSRDAIAMAAKALLTELATVTFDVVLCPESSGYFLGQAIAALTGKPCAIAAINALREPTKVLRRGDIASGASVLVVNDVVTTGKSLEPLLTVARGAGASVAGVAVFASLRPQAFARFRNDRGLAGAHLVSASWQTFAPAACPVCRTRESLIPAAEFN
jgi:orotate phosphoribosyltransferase